MIERRGETTLQSSKRPNLKRLARESSRVRLQDLLRDRRGRLPRTQYRRSVQSLDSLSSLWSGPDTEHFGGKVEFPYSNPISRTLRCTGWTGVLGSDHTAAGLGALWEAKQSKEEKSGVPWWFGAE